MYVNNVSKMNAVSADVQHDTNVP